MHRRIGLLACSVVGNMLAVVVASAAGSAGSPVHCAGATATTTTATMTTTTMIKAGSAAAAGACWTEVPYPFGDEGEAVNGSSCASGSLPGSKEALQCYLTVTSMAFRAWNRGLAATTEQGGGNTGPDPFGVWIFNGSRWYPSPGFLGRSACPGHTIVWAGKLDYWLVGPGTEWARLCRFDGVRLQWEPLELPTATKEHVAERVEIVNGQEVLKLKPGGITAAACFAWNNCSFLGTYGTVVHWNGHVLTDTSPDRSNRTLQGEYTGAVARQGPAGEPFGAAVGATSEQYERGPLESGGTPPAQFYGSSGGEFSPLAFTPPTMAQLGDPYRTDLMAVDVDAAGQGWVAGNPAGLRLKERDGAEPAKDPKPPSAREFNPPNQPQPSPLVPVSASGTATACAGPPPSRFTYTPEAKATEEAGAFLWSSIAVVPGAAEALAGGRMRRAKDGSGPNEDASVGEPVIAQAGCEGDATVTRFRIQDPTSPAHEAPADRESSVTAVAATAQNDAWATTSPGELTGAFNTGFDEPPHLYRLTNGQRPNAPEGNDEETRPLELKEDEAIIVIEPPKPEPQPQAPATTTQTHTVTLPAAVYGVKARLHTTRRHGHIYFSLYLTFKLRRPVTIGAQALRHGRVVSVARPRHFAGRTGLLILSLNRKHWPTNVRFVG
jgi:hypothetical protein